jgi:hypothetical protein
MLIRKSCRGRCRISVRCGDLSLELDAAAGG